MPYANYCYRPKLTSSKSSKPEQDLSARLRSLRNDSASPSPSSSVLAPVSINPNVRPETAKLNSSFTSFPSIPASQLSGLEGDGSDPLRNPHTLQTDDKTLDELLVELGPDDQWTLNPDDPKDIQELLDEAEGALPTDIDHSENKDKSAEKNDRSENQNAKQNALSRDLDMSVFNVDDNQDDGEDGDEEPRVSKSKEERLADEEREAQDIIAKALDEARLEKANEPSPQAKDENEPNFSLPSTPSYLPSPPGQSFSSTRRSIDFESDITSRLAALRSSSTPTSPFPSTPQTPPVTKPATNSLGLPSAPTFKPIEKPTSTIQKKFTNDEIDSWCIICSDDATISCLGCSRDLYCARCWKEGHTGPDVGFEERGHRWEKWRKPR